MPGKGEYDGHVTETAIPAAASTFTAPSFQAIEALRLVFIDRKSRLL